ncbi:MAG: 3-hydroxyacyl-ACP dehydratase FabZ family protein [Planctomycetota bacterium]
MTAVPTLLDRAAIEARLPHREPFLFVDRIVALELVGERPSIVGEWRVPPEAHFFRGHYPGNPVTPGVILCEHSFQIGALLLAELGAQFGATRGVPVLARIDKAKFKRMVRPGELVRTEVERIDTVGPASFMAGRVLVDGAVAVELACVLSRVEGGA